MSSAPFQGHEPGIAPITIAKSPAETSLARERLDLVLESRRGATGNNSVFDQPDP
jgi:hypothetical protein